MTLADKIRKARESTVDVDGRTWTVRRPSDEEAALISTHGDGLLIIVKRFVIGWPLTELDLVPGGTGVSVPFDRDLFGEWIADQPELWAPLGMAILEAYKIHTDKRDAAVKNS